MRIHLKGNLVGVEKNKGKHSLGEISLFVEDLTEQLTANELCHLHLRIEQIIKLQSTEGECECEIPRTCKTWGEQCNLCHDCKKVIDPKYDKIKPAEKEKGIEYYPTDKAFIPADTAYHIVGLVNKVNEIIRRMNEERG